MKNEPNAQITYPDGNIVHSYNTAFVGSRVLYTYFWIESEFYDSLSLDRFSFLCFLLRVHLVAAKFLRRPLHRDLWIEIK